MVTGTMVVVAIQGRSRGVKIRVLMMEGHSFDRVGVSAFEAGSAAQAHGDRLGRAEQRETEEARMPNYPHGGSEMPMTWRLNPPNLPPSLSQALSSTPNCLSTEPIISPDSARFLHITKHFCAGSTWLP